MEQEKHSLTLKTNCQAANLVSVQQELEGLQSQLEDRHRDEVRRLEEVCQRRAHADAQTNASLKAEVEKLEVLFKSRVCVCTGTNVCGCGYEEDM